ncbi:autotransporter outer membrane beta-barrel domain-containing protein [Bosea sp. 2YAB26]|uniref:autotransporter family protein n=1 Tax=Bosea sp. 2YAB26 TaxID=3237478 RepID=UPI003F9226DD
MANNLSVGANGTGTLTIQNGGTLTNELGTIGNLSGGVGTVIVTGPGSSWTNIDPLVVGGLGTGTLIIQDGGTAQDGTAASSAGGSIGQSAGSTGTVTVTGRGSSWINGPQGGLNIGSFGTGTLTIANGGTVLDITPLVTNIGNGAGSRGTVTVTGAGSFWSDIAGIRIGNLGTGALTIADGGVVAAPSVVIAANTGSTGTLNIGAGAGNPAAAPGTVRAPSVAFGVGTGTVNFNHTSSDYAFASAISGNGTVNVLAGTTTLTAANSYGGATNVTGGTLRAGGLNALSPNSAMTVASGGTLDLNGFSHVIPSVANAGLVSMGTDTAPGTLLTTPSYTGSGGTIGLNTVLGTDGSPSDRLVINGGSATGNSLITVTNAGGTGELTTGNGIQVVSAVNGGTTDPGAFALGGVVAAGAYEYLLFQGGVTPGTENDWFLRNQFLPTPPGVTPPVGPAPPGVTPPGSPIPLFRPEAALYTLLPGVARQLGLATLGTFHERQGDQALLLGSGALPGAWGRVFGRRAEERRSGLLSPEMKGNLGGFQAGQDLFGWDYDGHRDRLGLFLGFASADLDARGFALAQQRALVGKLTMDATSLGAYWTHIGPSRWYVNAVLLASWFDGDPRSTRGIGMSADGAGLTGSLEAGYPIQIGAGLALEPQAQLIWQSVSFGTERDRFSAVRFSPDDALTGRIGARLTGDWALGGMTLKPYLLANLWRTFSGSDTATFNVTPIATGFGYSSLELGGGVAAQVMPNVGVYAAASYTSNIGGDHRRGIKGNLGLRVTW